MVVTHGLGAAAVTMGLETLDVAKIHEHAMTTLLLTDNSAARRDEMARRGTVFFTETIVAIEATHASAVRIGTELDRLIATLDQRTLELVAANRELQQQISGRATAEAALITSERVSSQLLKDSRDLEVHLQQMTRQILTATEAERTKMSLQLNDEIAQSLLGIHVRMLALKQEIAGNLGNLAKEIAITQCLVEDSVNLIKHLANEFGAQYER